MRFFLRLLMLAVLIAGTASAQVKIGDPTGAPDPKAVLELKDTTRGFLLPRMTQAHMEAIAAPTDGLLIYNNTMKSIYQYRAAENAWMPIHSDSSEWFLDTTSKKLFLRRGLANMDSIYYNTLSKKFIFGDTRFFTGTTGTLFNMDEGNSDKFVFKVTASKFPRSMPNLNSAGIYTIWEADNDQVAIDNPYEASYTGIAGGAFAGLTATQRINGITGIAATAGNAGQDTALSVFGVSSNAYTRGSNYTETLMGIYNSVLMSGTNTANIGEIYGNFTSISYSNVSATRRVLGNIYGQYIGISGAFQNKVDGAVYGLYIAPVRGSSANQNFAIFSGKGHHHFGDSTLITDGPGFKARAVLDVQSTSAMIIPSGSTVQRPLTGINGMFRYNETSTALEYFRSTSWAVVPAVLTGNQVIDPPSIAATSTLTVSVAVTDANTNYAVTVSPILPLPSGIFIAYARVAGAGLVEISFGNMTASPVDLPAAAYTIKLVQ